MKKEVKIALKLHLRLFEAFPPCLDLVNIGTKVEMLHFCNIADRVN